MSSTQHKVVLATIRLLIADLCQQFGGGHGGGAMGMAAIAVALWRYAMRYAPHSPNWFDRDRVVLSNGHACLVQYIMLHLSGYKAMTMDQLKSYSSARVDKLCPGHPEIEIEGIEVTTGLLGQGIANAVGLAIATKHLGASFNKCDFDIVSNHTWCVCGDACLLEGVALEAISLAGHFKLNNLTLIYDNNRITCDGSIDLTSTDDINAKMRSCGWDVIDVYDGSTDVDELVQAFNTARSSSEKPTFVNVRTVIGFGSELAGKAESHSVAFGKEEISAMKSRLGFSPHQSFVVPDEVKDFFSPLPRQGEQATEDWHRQLAKYQDSYPVAAAQFEAQMNGRLSADWKSLIPQRLPQDPIATRGSTSLIFKPIAAAVPNFIVGTADISSSAGLMWDSKGDFQYPELRTQCGMTGSYSGRYIHYGTREHAMIAIANGLAAFAPGAIIPVTSSFLIFYSYAVAAIRMGALQELQTIHFGSHDSIGIGKDGPTHQPLEFAALYRAMPNLLYIRPADNEEVAGALTIAIESKRTPTIISTSRHPVPQLVPLTNRGEVAKGAYVLEEAEKAHLTIIGAGAELSMALDVAKNLRQQGCKVRTVSFPCQRLFEKQPREYRQKVLSRHNTARIAAVVIEPYVSNGWERYADAAICMGTDQFGKSLPGEEAYKYFGFEVDAMSARIRKYLRDLETGVEERGQFVELR